MFVTSFSSERADAIDDCPRRHESLSELRPSQAYCSIVRKPPVFVKNNRFAPGGSPRPGKHGGVDDNRERLVKTIGGCRTLCAFQRVRV